MVQEVVPPGEIASPSWQSESFVVYPNGTPDSVAVQVVPGYVKPVTVKLARSASDALVSSSVTLPEVQETLMVTSAVLSSLKSFKTSNWALLRVLTMVQVPTLRSALQVPVEV